MQKSNLINFAKERFNRNLFAEEQNEIDENTFFYIKWKDIQELATNILIEYSETYGLTEMLEKRLRELNDDK